MCYIGLCSLILYEGVGEVYYRTVSINYITKLYLSGNITMFV